MAPLKQIVQRAIAHFNDVDDVPLGEIRLEGVEREGEFWLVRLSALAPVKNLALENASERIFGRSFPDREYRTIKLDINTLEFKGIVLEHVDV